MGTFLEHLKIGNTKIVKVKVAQNIPFLLGKLDELAMTVISV